jgi:hypothetical protein
VSFDTYGVDSYRPLNSGSPVEFWRQPPTRKPARPFPAPAESKE